MTTDTDAAGKGLTMSEIRLRTTENEMSICIKGDDCDKLTCRMGKDIRDLLAALQSATEENGRLREAMKLYGRHNRRCRTTNYGVCDCGFTPIQKALNSGSPIPAAAALSRTQEGVGK